MLLAEHAILAPRTLAGEGLGRGAIVNLKYVGGSPTSNHFLLFVQKKVIKENHTPLPLHPSVLAPHLGRLRNSLRSNSPRRLPLPLKLKARQGDKNLLRPTVISA
jgi:hypothetical protein